MPSATLEQLRICYLSLPHMRNQSDSQYKIEMLQFFDEVGPYVWPVKLSVGVLSALISLLNVIVFTRKPMRRFSLNILLTALEVSYVLLSACMGIYSYVEVVQGDYASTIPVILFKVVCHHVVPVSTSFINWIAAIISFWRFLGILQPMKAQQRLSRKRAVLVVLVVALFTTAPAFSSFVIYVVQKGSSSVCTDVGAENTTNLTYYYQYYSKWSLNHQEFVINLERSLIVVNYLIPTLFLFVMTICLLSTICRFQKSQQALREGQSLTYIEKSQKRTTIVLIVLLGFYVLSNTVVVVTNHMHRTKTYQKHRTFLKTEFLLQGLIVPQVTNIFSILAYYFMGTNFRGTLHGLFSRRNKKCSVSTV